ncbi:threonine ammonia-lyase [Halobiforma lacisalsi AJ5]|uniref:threonine ammonia-lyase n=1 Tax=Natronobacterium lacisalsi AJ5 TaxID=358396 RepID=M0LMQ8_NATLA|nr:threonine ammonia-lyase [Halobiforma lacisalsi]APW97072.1 threonine ammonia-lyase [Halobiforma lacisalsi AJ5]EMA34791.1 threonine dehydratase [Halobiforma lacisalsi AJ5]
MTRSSDAVSFADVEAARDRLDDDSVVKHTPVERSTSLDELTGGEVHLKMEHLQWTGSFKTRGAYNKIAQTVEEGEANRVVAASAGNHAQGVALAATKLGIDSTIVMPRSAPQAKVDATREYGADVELVGTDFREAMAHARDIADDGGDVEFVHAYDDPAIVAGQGTLGLEMYEDLPEVDTIVVPIGGGGLISGIATAFAELSPDTRVVGVQASDAATVPDSLQKGTPVSLESVDTIADGIATGGISDLTLSLIEEHVDEVVTVTDGEIARAILLLLERAKQVVEGAGAASVAAIISEELDVTGETVMPLLCGGNLDMTMLQTVLVHALSDRDQLLRLRVRIDDQSGRMEEISGLIAKHNANIRNVRHDRSAPELDVGEAHLVFQIETSGAGQSRAIIRSIRDHGYEVKHVNA